MNDRRLVWNQVNAPDLSGASRSLARANQSFTGAFESAQGVIAKYGEGQKLAGDQELTRLLSSATNQEELNKLVNSDAVRGLNLSENGINILNDAQGNRVDWANTRSQIGSRDGLLGIAQSSEGRTAANYADATARRDFSRANAGNASAASAFARANGETFGPISETTSTDTRMLLARTLQAEAGNQGYQGMVDVGSVIRNRDASGKYGKGIEGVIMKPGQFSAWNGVTGYANGEQGQNMDFQPNDEALAAADAILSGQYTDETKGATNYYNPDISTPAWGDSSFVRRGAHVFGNADGGGPVNGNTGGIGIQSVNQTRQRQSPTDAYRQSLINSGLFSAAEIDQKMAPVDAAASQRGAEVTSLEQQSVAEQIAAANQEVLQDPNILTQEQLNAAIVGDTRFTASENEKRIQQVSALAETNPTRLAPTTTGTPGLDANVALANAAAENSLNSTDQNRAIGDIGNYAEDPAGKLSQELGLESDGQQAGAFGGFIADLFGKGGDATDQNQLKNMINDYARRLKVEPAVVAVAMRDSFNRDPFSIAGFNANTLGNRFEFSDVKTAVEQLDQTSIRNYNERKSNNKLMAIELDAIKTQARNLQRQIAKTTSPNQRQALEAQLSALDAQVVAIEKRRQ